MIKKEYEKLAKDLWNVINIEDYNASIDLDEDSILYEFFKEQLILELAGVEEEE